MTKVYKNRLSEEQVNSQAKQVVSQQPVQTQATQVSQQAPVQQATPTQQVQQSAPQNSQTANGQIQPNQTSSQPAENVQTQTAQSQQTTTPQTATNSQKMEQPFVSAQPTTKKAVVPQNQKWLSIITDPAMQDTICNYQGVISSATVNNGQLLIESYYKEKDILESLNIRLPKFMRKRLTEAEGIPTGAIYMQVDQNVQKRLGNDFHVTKVEGTNQGLIYTNQLGQTKIQKFLKDGQTLSGNINWLNKTPIQQPQQVQQAPTATANGQTANTQSGNNTSHQNGNTMSTSQNNSNATNQINQKQINASREEFAKQYCSMLSSEIKNINKELQKANLSKILKTIDVASGIITEGKNPKNLSIFDITLRFEFDFDVLAEKSILVEELVKFINKTNKKNGNEFTINGIIFSVEVNESKITVKNKYINIPLRIMDTYPESKSSNANNNDYMNYVKGLEQATKGGVLNRWAYMRQFKPNKDKKDSFFKNHRLS